MISIQPKWCELIVNGKKTIEVRKTKPKLETPFKVYIYETKGYDTLLGKGKPKKLCVSGGRVIGEFICDKIIDCRDIHGQAFFTLSCMSLKEWMKYTEGHKGTLWAWHISNLVIYDKPRELGEFRKPIACHRGNDRENCIGCWDCEIKRPPQSWCYVEGGENDG